MAYNHANRKMPKFDAFHGKKRRQFSLRASVKVEQRSIYVWKSRGQTILIDPHTRKWGCFRGPCILYLDNESVKV